jgi:hypothetical protein
MSQAPRSLEQEESTPTKGKTSLLVTLFKALGLCALALVLIAIAGGEGLPLFVRMVLPILAAAAILALGVYDAKSKKRLGQNRNLSIFSCAVGFLTLCGALLVLDYTEWHIIDGTGPVRGAALSALNELSRGQTVDGYSFNAPLLDLGIVNDARFSSVVKSYTLKGEQYELVGTAKFSKGQFDHFNYVKLDLISQGGAWTLSGLNMGGLDLGTAPAF